MKSFFVTLLTVAVSPLVVAVVTPTVSLESTKTARAPAAACGAAFQYTGVNESGAEVNFFVLALLATPNKEFL